MIRYVLAFALPFAFFFFFALAWPSILAAPREALLAVVVAAIGGALGLLALRWWSSRTASRPSSAASSQPSPTAPSQTSATASGQPSATATDQNTQVPVVSLKQATIARRWIFAYDLAIFFALLVMAWAYFLPDSVEGQPAFSLHSLVPPDLRDVKAYAFWFGALGGVAISLKGIYDHGPRDWQGTYNLWHLGRPLSGGIAGGITYLLLLAVSGNAPNTAVVLAAAFILGTQERRFFNFLSEVARIVVQVPGETQEAPIEVTEVHPDVGRGGTRLTLLGRGFNPGLTVWLQMRQPKGTVLSAKLEDVVVGRDGTTVTGLVPVGSGEATLLIENPDGAARVVSTHFTYQDESPPQSAPQPPEAPPPPAGEPDAAALSQRVAELENAQLRRNAIKQQFETYVRGDAALRTQLEQEAAAAGLPLADHLIASGEAESAPVDQAVRAQELLAGDPDGTNLPARVAELEADQELQDRIKAEFERYIREPDYRAEIDQQASTANKPPADLLIEKGST